MCSGYEHKKWIKDNNWDVYATIFKALPLHISPFCWFFFASAPFLSILAFLLHDLLEISFPAMWSVLGVVWYFVIIKYIYKKEIQEKEDRKNETRNQSTQALSEDKKQAILVISRTCTLYWNGSWNSFLLMAYCTQLKSNISMMQSQHLDYRQTS